MLKFQGFESILYIVYFRFLDVFVNIFCCFPGYTINIYVEMFHSEKQFDELEIFDGTQSFSSVWVFFATPLFGTQTHQRIHMQL